MKLDFRPAVGAASGLVPELQRQSDTDTGDVVYGSNTTSVDCLSSIVLVAVASTSSNLLPGSVVVTSSTAVECLHAESNTA